MSPSLAAKFTPGVKNIVGSAAVLSLILFIAWKVSVGPLYAKNDAAACRSKYVNATTLAETIAVDFLPYRDSTSRKGNRCGMTRTIALDSIAKMRPILTPQASH